MAKLFIEEQTRLFGTDHLYASDGFIEMIPPSGELDYLANISRAVYDGMAKTDPQAVWVLQGWPFMFKETFWTQPRYKAFLDAIPDDRMLVLDQYCERTPMWSRTDAFCGKTWLWCNVQNFARIVLGGKLDTINTELIAARKDPQAGKLSGLGIVNEGLGYNPVVFDLMFEMAWNNETIDMDQWIDDYAHHRYGKPNADARTAWRILRQAAYSETHKKTPAILSRSPSLGARKNTYDNVQLAQAWRHLLEAADELGQADTYRYDLVNVARQVLINHASSMKLEIAQARKAGDIKAFRQASEKLLQLIRDIDELLASRHEFLLGRWLEDAKRWGSNEAERKKMEWNARRILTRWGTGKELRDYCRKEWAGMLSGYYLKRWQQYLSELGDALEENRKFDRNAFQQQLWQWESDWAEAGETYPAEPAGDSVAVAKKLWAKYGEAFKPNPVR